MNLLCASVAFVSRDVTLCCCISGWSEKFQIIEAKVFVTIRQAVSAGGEYKRGESIPAIEQIFCKRRVNT